LFLLFVFYELAIVPKYFPHRDLGSTRAGVRGDETRTLFIRRQRDGLDRVDCGLRAGWRRSFSLVQLEQFDFPLKHQMWLFPLVFTGFAILAGCGRFIRGRPRPRGGTDGRVHVMAGVIMNWEPMAACAWRWSCFPAGWRNGLHRARAGVVRDVFGLLAVTGIVYGAMVALVQKDFKFVIGYSSVSHMGFVLLGLMTLTTIGVRGAVLQMFSHGVIAGLLFGVVGRMVYERTHTRVLDELEGMRLHQAMPFAAVVFVMAGLASMGLPGFSDS
jgi:NADH-quinone oxidoreductase subunit M